MRFNTIFKSINFLYQNSVWNKDESTSHLLHISLLKLMRSVYLFYHQLCSWWRHQMETFSALLAICAGNSPVPGEFPAQRPVTRSLDVFCDLRLNKRLNKQWWGCWFETPSPPLWRHRNGRSVPPCYQINWFHLFIRSSLTKYIVKDTLIRKNTTVHDHNIVLIKI